MREKDLQKKIRDYLNTLDGCHAFRVENRPGVAHGISDILGVYRGRFLAIECKMPKNKPTTLQGHFLDLVRENGGLALVAYSLGDVRDWLEEINVKP